MLNYIAMKDASFKWNKTKNVREKTEENSYRSLWSLVLYSVYKVLFQFFPDQFYSILPSKLDQIEPKYKRLKKATGIIIVLKLGDSGGDYKVLLVCEQVRIGMGLILDLYRELGVFYRAIRKGYRKKWSNIEIYRKVSIILMKLYNEGR